MIYSMTGYAARTLDVERGVLNIELKSVNSRFLDFQFRVCEELRAAEPALRELFSARLSRGKLECRVGFMAAAGRSQQQTLNGELLARLSDFEAQVRNELPEAAPLSVSEYIASALKPSEGSTPGSPLAPAICADCAAMPNWCRRCWAAGQRC